MNSLTVNDWTALPNGPSNSSDLFEHLVDEINRLIRGDAHMLLSGHSRSTARLILAQLAHAHHLAPLRIDLGKAAAWTERIFGPDVVAAEHQDEMTPEDWRACAAAILREAGVPSELLADGSKS